MFLSNQLLVLGACFVIFAFGLMYVIHSSRPDKPAKAAKSIANELAFLEKKPYYLKRPLSEPEQITYYRLMDAMRYTDNLIILSQVPLSRFLGVKKGNNHQEMFNRINRMSVDFLVVRKDFTVLAIIELDDGTHRQPDRIKADIKKNAVLDSANAKVIRWNVKEIPSKEMMQAVLMDLE